MFDKWCGESELSSLMNVHQYPLKGICAYTSVWTQTDVEVTTRSYLLVETTILQNLAYLKRLANDRQLRGPDTPLGFRELVAGYRSSPTTVGEVHQAQRPCIPGDKSIANGSKGAGLNDSAWP